MGGGALPMVDRDGSMGDGKRAGVYERVCGVPEASSMVLAM